MKPGSRFSSTLLRSHSPGPQNTKIVDKSSGFRIDLLTAPSHPYRQWRYAVFVPGYSGGSATDFNRLPFYGNIAIHNRIAKLQQEYFIVNTKLRKDKQCSVLPTA